MGLTGLLVFKLNNASTYFSLSSFFNSFVHLCYVNIYANLKIATYLNLIVNLEKLTIKNLNVTNARPITYERYGIVDVKLYYTIPYVHK